MPREPRVPDDAIPLRPGFFQPFRPGQSIRHIRKGPTILKPAGRQLTLPRPIAVIDGREHDGYTFDRFASWFAGIERRNLATGDYSIHGFETRIAIERKTLNDLYASTSPRRPSARIPRAVRTAGDLRIQAAADRSLPRRHPRRPRAQRVPSECRPGHPRGPGRPLEHSPVVRRQP